VVQSAENILKQKQPSDTTSELHPWSDCVTLEQKSCLMQVQVRLLWQA